MGHLPKTEWNGIEFNAALLTFDIVRK